MQAVLLRAALVTSVLLAGCSGDDDTGDGPDTPPVTALCEFSPPGDAPTVAEPNVTNTLEYTLELERWGIRNDGTEAVANTDAFQEALDWAEAEGVGHFIVPAGDYLIGKLGNDIYWAGIVIPGNMIFELDDAATIRMDANDKHNYCILAVRRAEDLIIRGGHIVGERDQHVYSGGTAHDEGHAICIEGNSERILVEQIELTEVTGDGVLIVGQGDAGNSCFDITIRDSEIHHNRRQGVSIVGGVRVRIENNDIHHISGTSPQFGIDVESLAFRSADIVIRNNRFLENQGGDLVNTDGTNLWFEDNICDQGALEERQTDGPIVHWGKSDQVVRGNTITVTVGSSNGRWGLIGYSGNDPDREGRGTRSGNEQPNYFENNTFIGGGLHMAKTGKFVVRGNTFMEATMLGYNVDCVRIEENDVTAEREGYKFRNVAGEAFGNILNEEPREFLMADDSPYTNSPPHLW